MKFSVSALLLATSFAASSAFADAANTLITFSTPGPDTYADGETVKDGEVYALVWSSDGVFDGFTAAGAAVDPADRVFFKAPLAKDGKCGLTLFQIDSKDAPQGGVYAVYLLDTRAGQGLVTGSALAKTYKGTSGTANIAAAGEVDNTVNEAGEAVAVKSTAAGIAGDVSAIEPVIKGIQVDGAQVTIQVGNLVPGLNYTVMGGLKRDAVVQSVGFKSEKEATIVLKSSEKFFSIKAE